MDIFPQGQAATNIIPIAIEADGFHNKTNKKVINGSNIICDKHPMITDLGFVITVLKSSFLISIAKEKRINAKHIFKTTNPSLAILTCACSIGGIQNIYQEVQQTITTLGPKYGNLPCEVEKLSIQIISPFLHGWIIIFFQITS